jgi:hypothetical protein
LVAEGDKEWCPKRRKRQRSAPPANAAGETLVDIPVRFRINAKRRERQPSVGARQKPISVRMTAI